MCYLIKEEEQFLMFHQELVQLEVHLKYNL
jgi:hypothetical protein